MKLAWRRATDQVVARTETVETSVAGSQAAAVIETTPGAGMSPASALDPALPGELRLLCRGLVYCSWCDRLEIVTTEVHLPDDEAHALALRALCQELAEEFAVEQTVRREDEAWIVRFSRREAGLAATEEERERPWYRSDRALFGVLARPDKAARRLHGPRLRGRAYAA